MKRGASGGFTIVESMIVLAISGFLFVSLAGLVAGQQSKARFKAAMTDVTTQIQSQINEVSTGYYPNTGNFKCSMDGNGRPAISSGSVELGKNPDCTFLGRAMMYGIQASSGQDTEQYAVQTLVGVRRTSSGDEPTTLREARTEVIAPGEVIHNYKSWPDNSTMKNLRHGVTVAWMCNKGGVGPGCLGGSRIAGFAIAAAPNNQLTHDVQSGAVESGALVPSIIPIPSPNAPSPGLTAKQGVDLIVRSLGVPPPGGPSQIPADASDGPVKLCFLSGTTNQSALVTIGAGNSSTSVEFIILNSKDCT